jgi:hypothetical protein
MLFTSTKNRGRRVLFPLKRANTAPFGLCDRAAGQQTTKQANERTKRKEAAAKAERAATRSKQKAESSPACGVVRGAGGQGPCVVRPAAAARGPATPQ